MIGDMTRWASRFIFYMVLWVFILSVRWDGRTLFDRAHEIIIENPVVELLDEELQVLWERISDTARTVYADIERKRSAEPEAYR